MQAAVSGSPGEPGHSVSGTRLSKAEMLEGHLYKDAPTHLDLAGLGRLP